MEFSDPKEAPHDAPPPSTSSLRQSTRERCLSQRLINSFDFTENLHYFTQGTEPQTIKEALSCPNAHEWQRAMDAEYQALLKNKTRTLTQLPPGHKTVGCK